MSVPEYVNRPTDGNPAAPLLPIGSTPIARELPTDLERKLTAFADWWVNRDSDREKRCDVRTTRAGTMSNGDYRAVHAGATSHDTEAA